MAQTQEIEVYVRFCETDAAGHVNNTSYFLYLEEAWTKFFHVLGIGRNDGDSALNFILASTTCDYLAQAFSGQMLKVTTSVSKVGTKSFTVNHLVTTADTGIEIAKGSAVIVCFNYVDQKTKPIPTVLRKNLESHLIVS